MTATIICRWYALCANEAVGTTSHPVLGDVPICQRCASKHDLPIELPAYRGRPIDTPTGHRWIGE